MHVIDKPGGAQMTDQPTVLGQLMQNEADLSQMSDDQREASWNEISKAIDVIDQERKNSSKAFPRIGSISLTPDEDWNPKTAFNTRPTPRNMWRLPSRRLAAAMIAVFLGVVALLAGALYLQTSGILPGPTTTTIDLPDDPIPLADPDAPVPELNQLMVFLSESDSRQLLDMSGMTPDKQKTIIEGLSVENCMPLSKSGDSAIPGTSYWVARKLAGKSDKMLVLLARERVGEVGWQAIFQILPKSGDIPAGAALDDYFSKQLAKQAD